MREVVTVDLADRSYDIIIGEHLLPEISAGILRKLGASRVGMLVDRNVRSPHVEELEAELELSGIRFDTMVVPEGETSKSWTLLEQVVEWLLGIGLERTDVVVAVGGGVVGDLAGFAASVVRRGVRCVQVPTTLLAQVDSSVGGKTGINSSIGKNLIGAFHQPSLVVCDIAFLKTLPRRVMLAGYAEVAKYGLLWDADFFVWLEQNASGVASGNREDLIAAIKRSCEIKAEVVALDETEQGSRALLNLGHTFAHALETDSGYSGNLMHGEAVAVGCCLAFDLSSVCGHLDGAIPGRVRRHFRALGMATDTGQLHVSVSGPDRLVELMAQDKKVVGGKNRFVLAKGIGRTFVADDVDLDAVRAVLELSAGRSGI